ncbi:nuclear transport factor 2 family protein [Mycobacteroides chelonae]|uniref:SnoaL-like domain-containing protein n=1 Tax=Mycobacteroides chelonae TaxID=1774 RepID=A0A1S1M7L3_MYCCH|nr:nuclear transport factor 2 family protein [Mycobacteroides chelonae]OHU78838.1 hypothetical protein BKG84_10965 [Mycobacteroides chelonae]QQG85958.1 SnoaL-like domain-containing protein [Mycobacteroides chelonae]QQG90775.1 SnoaL-like domain-containing protein [Mycobacteroides chelonae]
MNPQSDRTTSIAWSFFELLNSGNIDEALEVLHEEGTWWVAEAQTRPAMPMRLVKDPWRTVHEKVPMRFTLRDAIEAGDRVVLEVESASHDRERPYDNKYCFFITVRDNKIFELHEYVDTRNAHEVLIPLLGDTAPWAS